MKTALFKFSHRAEQINTSETVHRHQPVAAETSSCASAIEMLADGSRLALRQDSTNRHSSMRRRPSDQSASLVKLNPKISTAPAMLTLSFVIHCTATLASLVAGLQLATESESNRLIPTSSADNHLSTPNQLSGNNSSPLAEPMATAASESHETGGYGPPNSSEYSTNFDENPEGADLNFTLMNAPHDKIQAVKHLINTQRSLLSQQQQLSQHDLSTGNSLQCTHKGRHYLNGQTVPIEDQPCLNCTCRRAILQCYLRVCPPIISLEAHRRTGAGGANNKCHTVKEAHQCCPTTRCEPAYESASSNSSSAADGSSGQASDASTVSLSSAEDDQNARLVTVKGNSDSELIVRIEQASNRSVNELAPAAAAISATSLSPTPESAPQDNSNLPKLTVIKGPAGQRDSILLITSNPNAAAASVLHAREKMHLDGNGTSLPSDDQLNAYHLTNNNNHHHGHLLDSLLETVYSSVAQLNGLNLQGSCMINGSLYVEGSAVIPKGNAYCQYCYCIRQKIMCIKPKCHLMISGCTAKYSNEYACCPTSYSCSNNDHGSLLAGSKGSPYAGSSAAQLSSSAEPHSLSARLSAVIESLSRLSAPAAPDSGSAAAVSPRQVDGARDSEHSRLPSAMLALLSSVAGKQVSSNNRTNLQANNSSAQSPTTTTSAPTTSTTTTTTTTTTSTPAPTRSSSASPSSTEREGPKRLEGDEDGEDEEEETEADNGARKADKKVNSTERPADQTSSSVSDFLEPMNKLGPLVVSPTSCTENGRQYAIGEQIPTLESCKHCYCGLDGIKECKMIECSLKIAHNCKPITPEGHCCPVRYDCPSSQQQAHLQRYRSETGNKPQPERANPVDASLSQCKSDTGLDDCSSAANQTSFDDPAGVNSGSGVENIRGLTVDNEPFPILKSTRIIDDNPLATPPAPLNRAAPDATHLLTAQAPGDVSNFESMRTKNSSAQQLSLSEELSKFIMQISQNSTQGTGYSLLPSAAPAADQASGNFAGQRLNDTTQEMMINDQHSRMVDYHSVQAPRQSTGNAALSLNQPEPLGDLQKEGRPEITGSGQIVPVAEPEVGGRAILSSVEYAGHPDDRSQVSGGQRDSRSNNALNLASPTPGDELANVTLATQALGDNRTDFDDYLDDNSAPRQNGHLRLNTSGLPHIRLMRNNHQPPHTTPLVVFDDNLNNIGAGSSEPVTTNPLNDLFNTRPNFTGTENPTTNLPILEEVSTTRLPPQPTTGTPIGLEADRGNETRGWLKSLSGIVQSFGRRLSGTVPPEVSGNELEGSASAGSLERENRLGEAVETPRSKQQSVFNQILEMIKSSEQLVATNREEQPAKELVMRPLAGVVRFESDEGAQVQDPARLNARTRPPYEPNVSASSSEVEIVTAAVPLDREIFESPVSVTKQVVDTVPKKDSPIPVATGSSIFSRRSDTADDDQTEPQNSPLAASNPTSDRSTGYFTLSTSALDSNGNALYRVDKQISDQNRARAPSRTQLKSLSCYDTATNKTYQANEIIPKNDPCKTCTCILGEELCQTLVCPEKPADDCKEERRPGECCANYLCSNNVTKLDKTAQDWPRAQGAPEESNAKLFAKPQPGSMVATQRALQVNSDSQNTADRSSPRMVVSSASSLSHQAPPMINNHARGGSIFDNRGRQQLPQQPIRTSDLQNILPPHLRFRPNLQNNLYVPNQQANNMLNNQQTTGRRGLNQDSVNQFLNPINSQVRRSDFAPLNNRISFNLAAQNQFNNRAPSNSFMNPSVLSHPSLTPGGGRGPSSIHAIDLPTRRNLLDEQTKPNEQNIWRQAVHQQPHAGGILPPNILTSRMSGPQTPPVHLISENRSSGNGSNWLGQPPLSHIAATAAAPLPQQDQINGAQPPLAMRPLDLSSLMISSSERPPQAPQSNNELLQKDRVLFQDPPSSRFNLNSNSVDTGFRPIMVAQRTVTENPIQVTSSADPSTTESKLSTTDTPLVEPKTSPIDPATQQTAHRQPDTSEPTRVDSFIVTRVPEDVVATSTKGAEETSTLLAVTESSLKPSNTAATEVSRQQKQEATEASSPNSSSEVSSSSSQTTGEPTVAIAESHSFDPFRVSECNIYGRIYKVGASINELSDACKKCSCTSNGVECQMKC